MNVTFGIKAKGCRVFEENQNLIRENNGLPDCNFFRRVAGFCLHCRSSPCQCRIWMKGVCEVEGAEGGEGEGSEEDGGENNHKGEPEEGAP